MKKLRLIIEREFIAKVRNKSFIVMTFLSPILMIAMGALVVFLMKKNDEKEKTILYVDASKLFTKDDFEDSKTIKYQDFTILGIEKTKEKVEKGDYYGALYIPKQDSLEILSKSIEFYSKESPSLPVIADLEGKVNKKLRNLKLTSFGIDLEKIEISKLSSDIKMFNFSGEKSSKLINGLKIGVGVLAGYLLMMFVMIYGTSVMRSVIEEKTSRIIEVIVSSVKPFQLMLGKIIGNASAGLLQFFIWGILFLIASFIVSSFLGMSMLEMQAGKVPSVSLDMVDEVVVGKSEILLQELFRLPLLKMFFLFVFYFLGGYMLYSSLFAAVGAAVDNETDTQQFMMPIMLPLILAVYVGFATVINDPHGPISVIFSYIPFTSPIVMLMRVPFGVSWFELVVSMALLLITFVIMVWLAAKIYRVGILMYGKKPSYKDLWKWIKYKG
ncbi:ABC transporter permease [Tenacibaculum maritimum]|uniref:Probable ABC-type Na(+)-transporting system, permease component n=1 Tax=Tenacibaculum maritimum NCIMB 2154 TaxID=1349785 RepID=A0A2H1E7Q7_9FLAO|nr:ABC transporter permease [Tenacibaculum maritimum]MCD9563320.1 ABC transporter permease [Tenacibaculum maritimum]MCD9565268.1 ABC transporter permease [Tenacibaculum maritimum]MCD9578819.1 ABC transporter permease [Tenacibaculum maritimum]MCD9584656.1 ABC transporter permease [Tenacibaculum maritimum]MCD9597720.1 ABC transporter permease [Tenacibaculum maritimum]